MHLSVFVWFSSDTAQLDHASVMSYSVEGDKLRSWFAAFHKTNHVWKVNKVKGIAPSEVQAWFPLRDG